MIYSVKGLKVTYPDNFKWETDLLCNIFEIYDPKTKVSLNFSLEPQEWNLAYSCNIRFMNPTTMRRPPEGLELLRSGAYERWPGARENLIKRPVPSLIGAPKVIYSWIVIVPFENRIGKLFVNENDLHNIDQLWKPIVDSIEFQPSVFFMAKEEDKNLSDKIDQHDWSKVSFFKKSKHFQHIFYPPHSFLAFYDSSIEYDPSVLLNLNADTMATGVMKEYGQATILTHGVLTVVADFYLNEPPPTLTDKKWVHIVEGLISIGSGRLLIGDGVSIEVEILMKGNFKFRIYYEPMNPEDQSWDIRIYFWKSDEKDNNSIDIIKPLAV